MSKIILGLDLGSNSLGWSLLKADENQTPIAIIDAGVRIFLRSVEDKTPTPKNVKRRESRLTRRVIQRRHRRKIKMKNLLIDLHFLPTELKDNNNPEVILNSIGDPYFLRHKALDEKLSPFELGRVLLHLTARRGFLSNKKALLGEEMLDDPDVLAVLNREDIEDSSQLSDSEESQFKAEIKLLKSAIVESGARTLGEYLAKKSPGEPKRNRDDVFLRTDRAMYKAELEKIMTVQTSYFPQLDEDIIARLHKIIFFQRPLKLNADRIGKCGLEPSRRRCKIARLEFQRFRYLQDINNLKYFSHQTDNWIPFTYADKQKLKTLFERNSKITLSDIKKEVGLSRNTKLNYDGTLKHFKGNITSILIGSVYSTWSTLCEEKKLQLTELIITTTKKSTLKNSLISKWNMSGTEAVELCLLEFEDGQSKYSLKAINKLLPFLTEGDLFSDSRIKAGYDYEIEKLDLDKLEQLPETSNPIVNRGLQELKRLINALIKEYGKPDIIRVEMARDLEMNTKRYKANLKQQQANTKANIKAQDEFAVQAKLVSKTSSTKATYNDKLKYRLWTDQNQRCAYSNKNINMATLFTADIEIDHIVPFSQSLDDSYMNKVVCFSVENRMKGQQTPIDAFGNIFPKWSQITSGIHSWDQKQMSKKIERFYIREQDILNRDFVSTQLNDTRYISRLSIEWLKQLGCDVTTTKGTITSWLRHQWGLNSLLGVTNEKERNDHRHHQLDAIVIACVSRGLYQELIKKAKSLETKKSNISMKDIPLNLPFDCFRDAVDFSLNSTLVSIAPNKKLSGALHEETGVGFSEKHGGTVYRKQINKDFKAKDIDKILDIKVGGIVRDHLASFYNIPAVAFSGEHPIVHKDGVTRIKRVRVLQAKTSIEKLAKDKLGIYDRNGEIFKWHAYGNTHHVAIFKKDDGTITGDFVTMFEASKRAKKKLPIYLKVKENNEFLFALHKNDTIKIKHNGINQFFRIIKLDKTGNRAEVCPVNKSKPEKVDKQVISISKLIVVFQAVPCFVNILGKLKDD